MAVGSKSVNMTGSGVGLRLGDPQGAGEAGREFVATPLTDDSSAVNG